jgi:predicted acylesterase/phospholipase RssA
MTKQKESHFALVLPGAVASGAYEAGVIDTLAQEDVRIDRIVATSSGALNGMAYAAGIRAGREKEMAETLADAWLELGSWNDSFSFNPLHWLSGRGLSGHEGLLKMMRALVKPCSESKKREVELRIIVAPLNGVVGNIGGKPATTYERIVHFTGKDFDTQEGLDRIFQVVAAACSFPGIFAPVDLPGLGPCIDGGAVNNAPIAYALSESNVKRVIMAVPYPSIMPPPKSLSGVALLTHLAEILIHERLYRDLNEAQTVNQDYDDLQKLVANGVITPEQLLEIEKVLIVRKVEITEIRPRESLKGTPFTGFFKKEARARLIDEGRKAAKDTLAKIPAHNPTGRKTT